MVTIAIVPGFGCGILLFIGLQTFVGVFKGVDPLPVLMALLTTFPVAAVGITEQWLVLTLMGREAIFGFQPRCEVRS